MDFLKRLFGGPSPRPAKRYYIFNVQCRRCKEVITGRVDLDNDLSVEYEEGGDVYYVRKVLMGAGTCFQKIEVHMKFSADRAFLESEVIGGDIVS